MADIHRIGYFCFSDGSDLQWYLEVFITTSRYLCLSQIVSLEWLISEFLAYLGKSKFLSQDF